MGMHVDQAGDDGFTAHIHDGIPGAGLAFPDAKELAFLDDDVALLDHLIAFHGDDLGAHQGETARRGGVWHRHLELGFGLLAGGGVHQDKAVSGNQLHFGRTERTRAGSPVGVQACAAFGHVIRLHRNDGSWLHRGEWLMEQTLTALEQNGIAIGRKHGAIPRAAARWEKSMHALIATARRDRNDLKHA